MGRVISIHEYELKAGVDATEFEDALKAAEGQRLFQLPGLVRHRFLKGLKGDRKGKYAAIWIYESREAWKNLWGSPDQPKEKSEYPARWQKWENLLKPFLVQNPDEIIFTSYEEM